MRGRGVFRVMVWKGGGGRIDGGGEGEGVCSEGRMDGVGEGGGGYWCC